MLMVDLETWICSKAGIITISLEEFDAMPIERANRFLCLSLASLEIEREEMSRAGR